MGVETSVKSIISTAYQAICTTTAPAVKQGKATLHPVQRVTIEFLGLDQLISPDPLFSGWVIAYMADGDFDGEIDFL